MMMNVNAIFIQFQGYFLDFMTLYDSLYGIVFNTKPSTLEQALAEFSGDYSNHVLGSLHAWQLD